MASKKNIMIVDDEIFFRQVLRDILEANYNVIEACSGDEAISIIEKSKPDLIILDVEMPGKSGLEICKSLKDDFGTRDIPVMMMTSHTGKKETVEGLNAGADDYIMKPIHPPEVIARIESHLRTKGYYAQLEPKDLVLLLELSETISASRNPHKILRYIVDKIAEVIDVARCSIVSIDSRNNAVVKASTDMPADKEIEIDLDKYPEIKEALKTKEPVVVNDLKNDPIMDAVKKDVEFLEFNSVVVVPMIKKESVIGTFFLRTTSPLVNGITDRIIKLCQLMGYMSANALENAVLFEEMENARFKLEQMALMDNLTGLYNHRYFFERLYEEFSRAERYELDLSCIFIDLDDFKKINDIHGHLKGDDVLRSMGLLISEVIRESDIAARYGGEEFALLLPDTGRDGALILANRLCSIIRDNDYEGFEKGSITASIGVVSYNKDNKITSPDELVQVVDGAMYKAKELGKNQVFEAS